MRQFYVRDVVGWGCMLWLIGYVLGFVFFAFVPPAQIGWYVMPLGIAVTIFVLWTRVRSDTWLDAAIVGLGWVVIAIVCDYLFLVLLLDPADGYYKLDVYLYYVITLLLPLAVFGARHLSSVDSPRNMDS